MQNPNEIEKINNFLNMVAPVLTRQLKLVLQSSGLEVREHGCGADQAFLIKRGNKEISFLRITCFWRLQLPTAARTN